MTKSNERLVKLADIFKAPNYHTGSFTAQVTGYMNSQQVRHDALRITESYNIFGQRLRYGDK